MAEPNHGTDVAGISDVDPEGKMVSGRTLLAQAVARRYQTPRGRLIDDPNYGEDLTEHINDDMSASDLEAMRFAAEQEAKKDERVREAEATILLTAAGVCRLDVTLTDEAGPFKLTLTVDAVSVTLLAVSP